jgi:hypothetical protein
MSINVNLTESEVSILLSALNYLNEEQEVNLTHKYGSVRIIHDKMLFTLSEMQQSDNLESRLHRPDRPLNGFGNVKQRTV